MVLRVYASISTRATIASSLASSSSGVIDGSAVPSIVLANRSRASLSSASLWEPRTTRANHPHALTLHLPPRATSSAHSAGEPPLV